MTAIEKERYSRQILFRPIGEAGQEKIRHASVCIVGCGALGSYQAEALARAGIGSLRLIDRDYVDYTNLQRQSLYDESDARNESPKAIAAARRLEKLNAQVQIKPLVTDLTPSNAEELVAGCDLILDGSDNFETRYLLNDLSVKLGIPWIYGAAIGSYGLVMPVVPKRGPCRLCLSGSAAGIASDLRCRWRAGFDDRLRCGFAGCGWVAFAGWLGRISMPHPDGRCLGRHE